MKDHKFPYEWKLADGYPANGIEYHGAKVFSCFACGGGSTMGYKLAGYDVIGCNEIDPKMAECYKANHNPRFCFVEPIQTFKDRDDLPPELYDLGILDGSPPCSSFSMFGNREKDWGKEKKFREGQAEQVLDTLFFDFIDLGKKLQPKVMVAENVKTLLAGNAQLYVSRILDAFDSAGYFVDFKVLDASEMGVPQSRQRVFFYAIRKDLYAGEFSDLFMSRPILNLDFSEPQIPYSEIEEVGATKGLYGVGPVYSKYWELTNPGNLFSENHPKKQLYGCNRAHPDRPLPTLLCQDKQYAGSFHYSKCRALTFSEVCLAASFPIDYQVTKEKDIYKFCGMSVPPVMMAQIATRIKEQWL